MINQVSSNIDKKPFNDFNSVPMIERYFLPADFQNDDFIKEETEKKHSNLGIKIGLTTLSVGFGTLALMKGLPKNTYKYFGKFKKFIEQKFSMLTSEVKSEKLNKKYNDSMNRVNNIIEKSQCVNNLGWIKDISFKRLLGMNKYTAKLHANITKAFEKVSLKTVNKAYKSSENAFSEMFNLFDNASNKIDLTKITKVDGTPIRGSAVLKKLAEKRKLIADCLNENFDVKSRNIRHEKMRDSTRNLVTDFWKEFKSKKLYKSSIADELLASSKSELAAPLKAARETLAGKGRDLSGGNIKEMLDIYKELLSPAEYAKLEAAAQKSIKKLDKAIHVDAYEFFDKYRDLVMGCAPTDMLSIATSIGTIGYGLSTADDKDERYSVLLNVGIPIIGSIATTLYFTARLVSGFKSLGLGLLSGLVFAKAGNIVDNNRKKFDNKTQQSA